MPWERLTQPCTCAAWRSWLLCWVPHVPLTSALMLGASSLSPHTPGACCAGWCLLPYQSQDVSICLDGLSVFLLSNYSIIIFFFFLLDGAQFTVWGWFAKRATQLCSRSCVKDGVTFLRQVRGTSVVRPGWEGKSYFLQYFCLVFLLTSHFNLEFLLAFSWRIVFVHHFRT